METFIQVRKSRLDYPMSIPWMSSLILFMSLDYQPPSLQDMPTRLTIPNLSLKEMPLIELKDVATGHLDLKLSLANNSKIFFQKLIKSTKNSNKSAKMYGKLIFLTNKWDPIKIFHSAILLKTFKNPVFW